MSCVRPLVCVDVNALVRGYFGFDSLKVFATLLLAAYSHSAQATDLRLCHTAALTDPVMRPRSSANIRKACTTDPISAT